jgi:hypothetical protein
LVLKEHLGVRFDSSSRRHRLPCIFISVIVFCFYCSFSLLLMKLSSKLLMLLLQKNLVLQLLLR